MPSNDIFRKLLSALDTDLASFLSLFDQRIIKNQLSQISDVEHWLNQKANQRFEQRRQYLTISSMLIIIAVTLFYTGFSKHLFSETKYEYYSEGVVLVDEPPEIFSNWRKLIDQSKGREVHQKKLREMTQRTDRQTMILDTNVANYIEQKVEGGSRFYVFKEARRVPQTANTWLQIFGVLLFSCGVMGFVLERKLFK